MRTRPINIALLVALPIAGGALLDVLGRNLSAAPFNYLDNLIFVGLGLLVGTAVALGLLSAR